MFCNHAVKGAGLTKCEHVRDTEQKLRLSELKIFSKELQESKSYASKILDKSKKIEL